MPGVSLILGQDAITVNLINVNVEHTKMPYIDPEERLELDNAIQTIVEAIRANKVNLNNPHDISSHLGRINYTFSRILCNLMGDPSYNKIAMITGVLENIKQEFYRRVASYYENLKIRENGDIPEYLPPK